LRQFCHHYIVKKVDNFAAKIY